jgi:hypothetical protein
LTSRAFHAETGVLSEIASRETYATSGCFVCRIEPDSRKIHPQHQFCFFRLSAPPPAFGVKGRYLFLKGRPRDNRVRRVRKLFPSPGPFPLRVFRVDKCLLCVHVLGITLQIFNQRRLNIVSQHLSLRIGEGLRLVRPFLFLPSTRASLLDLSWSAQPKAGRQVAPRCAGRNLTEKPR